ncbi:MAG: alpha-D-mannose-alpha,1-6-phosphatidyl myo-inositol monomannoside transferase [Bacteroidales bacterium 45-6]|nr:MAG: alpha-D-mannose-alpha,1-6-phosphatidyl myo-inositol monomannoside transferase [Bacteroidales bacterium 45-6]
MKTTTNKVKVAFFADMLIEDFDGASRTMYQLINRIPSDKFEFLFVCGTGPERIAGFKCMRVMSLSVPGNKSYRFATTFFQKAGLEAHIEAFSPDIVHIATPSLLGNFAMKTARKMGLPVISIYHTHFVSYVDYYVKSFPFLIDFTKDKLKNSLRTFYNQCDIVYVPSKTMIKELHATGIRPEILKLWQRGIDRKVFSPNRRNTDLVQKITGNANPCILFVSRLVWEKNVQIVIDLYKLAEQLHLKYNFIVVGDGVAREEMEKQMPNAHFLGFMGHEQLANVYASCDVFLFPSTTETFGNVVLEALASGLPCVVANGGGSRDFIEDGYNGYRCEQDNAQDFLNRIWEILKNPELAQMLSHQAVETSRKYTWETLAKEYFEDLKFLPEKISAI